MYGLSDKETTIMNGLFEQVPHLESVILYGSRAKGNYRKYSDVDITLTGNGLTISDQYKLENLLYESDLPYFYDVSILDKITNPDLVDHIRRRGITIWGK